MIVRTGIKILFVFFLLISDVADAQWVSDPEKNTLLVTNCFDPVNISSVDDLKGGLFVFWEDNLNGFQSDISFVHINGDGIASFRTDGKKISASGSPKSNPISVTSLPNSSFVVWKEVNGGNEQLTAQRISASGSFLWNQYGFRVSEYRDLIGAYSADSDSMGRLFTAYIPREPDSKNQYPVKLQGLSAEGRFLFKDIVNVAASVNKKTSISCLADGSGGISIFWLENINGKSQLLGQKIDSSGKSRWGTKPVIISGLSENVFSFGVKEFSSSVYIVWQTQKTDKDIYHQLIGQDGKIKWQRNEIQILPAKGNQTNPQAIISDNDIFLTWTDDSDGDRNILMQKFGNKGEKLWNRNTYVIKLEGDQFGQKILHDGEKGAIITWIDRRVKSVKGNIYSQRVSTSGKLQWDSLGVSVAGFNNTEKSYITLIPDITGGAVVVFKEKRSGENEIFGQKIFNTGTFTSQIIAFNTELTGDSVKVSWYSANEQGPCVFQLERTSETDSASTAWKKILSIGSEGNAAAKYYEVYDKPGGSGTVYYRVVHSDISGDMPSELSKIDYLGTGARVFVSQNLPNPFSDKTIFNIYLSESAEIKVEFFDSHLEKIREVEGKYPAGNNAIEFSANGLQPGIYFYKVHSVNFVDVKKMVIINEG